MTNLADTHEFLNRLLEEGIKPLSEKIATIHLNGDVAVLFFEIETGDSAEAKTAMASAKDLGWTGGRAEVAAMTKTRAAKFADAIATIAPTDPAIAWLRGRKSGRIFVCVSAATLCVNFVPGTGFTIEPGTLDRQWLS